MIRSARFLTPSCLQVPQVTPSGSPVLPGLSVLWLRSNRLTSLSDGSFSACPALTELYLDNNAIDTLSNHAFAGLGKLEVSLLASKLQTWRSWFVG